jgi:Fe-Mn family superoxide dismutase
MAFELPDLPHAHDALGPYMSAETLEFHHDKHHQAYVTNGNNILAETDLKNETLENIVIKSHGNNAGLFNNAAQHYNHLHFWKMMTPGGSKVPSNLESKINEDLGGMDKFRADFINAGVTQFGSGWCWLELKNGKLNVSKTPNGENPLVNGATPLLGCDVWEHSYYIDYSNARPKYLEAWFDNLVNWEYVTELLENSN